MQHQPRIVQPSDLHFGKGALWGCLARTDEPQAKEAVATARPDGAKA